MLYLSSSFCNVIGAQPSLEACIYPGTITLPIVISFNQRFEMFSVFAKSGSLQSTKYCFPDELSFGMMVSSTLPIEVSLINVAVTEMLPRKVEVELLCLGSPRCLDSFPRACEHYESFRATTRLKLFSRETNVT